MKKKAVAYMRCSTDMQDCSVSDQRDAIQKWSKRNKYAIVREYVDDGISGYKAAKRPGFLQMVSDINLQDFEAVLIWDSYRFSRNLIESLTYKKMFRDNGVKIIAITEPILDEDSDAQLYIDALNGVSGEMYIRKLSKDVSRALIAKAERGEYNGKSPYGYGKNPWDKDFHIIEDEMKWVAYMFKYIADGGTYHGLVQILRNNEVRTHKGNYFDSRGVWRILTNPIYKGVFTVTIKGVTIKDQKASNIPAGIPSDLWDSVHDLLQERSERRKKYYKPDFRRKHWLSGHCYCSNCGSPFCYAYKSSTGARFQCKGYSRGLSCYKSVKVDLVEKLVVDKLISIYDGTFQECERYVSAVVPEKIYDYDKEIAKLRASLTRAKKAYLAEIDTLDEYRETKDSITSRIADLEERKASANRPPAIDIPRLRERVMNAVSILQSDCDMSQKIGVADALIDRIIVDTSSKTIELYFFA